MSTAQVLAPWLVVFAKSPRPGLVKTRMSPALSPEQAASLYACMLADVVHATAGFAERLGMSAVLAVHPAEARAELARQAPRTFRVIEQRGAGLAERMRKAVDAAFAAGAAKVILRGSDSPILEADLIEAALAGLDTVDLVLAPDQGGGYGLIGLRRPCPSVFRLAMSTTEVCDETLRAARQAGASTRLLAPCLDVDEPSDLSRLANADPAVAERLCPRTLRWMREQALPDRLGDDGGPA